MSRCARCGTDFQCCEVDGNAIQPCWCTQLPSLPASDYLKDADGVMSSCLCPHCLQMGLSMPEPQAQRN
jgi:hypothetical protein